MTHKRIQRIPNVAAKTRQRSFQAKQAKQLISSQNAQTPYTPQQLLQLQRLVGNQQVRRMIEDQSIQVRPVAAPILVQQFAGDSSKTASPGIQRNWTTATPSKTTAGPTFSTITSDKVGALEKLKGLRAGKKKGKKIPSLVETITEGQSTPTQVLTPQEHVDNIGSQATSVSTALRAGSFFAVQTAVSALVGTVLSYIKAPQKIIKAIQAVYKSHKARKDLDQFHTAKINAKQRAQTGDAAAQAVYASAKYGHEKVRRRFVESIVKAAISIGKAIVAIADLVTGGTAVMFTSIGKLVTTSGQLAFQTYHAGKALYKAQKGTKGVHRAQNAEEIIKQAHTGQPDAVFLLFKLKIGKRLWQEKQGIVPPPAKGKLGKLKQKLKDKVSKSDKYVANERELVRFLRSLSTAAEFDELRDDLKKKMSSTAFGAK